MTSTMTQIGAFKKLFEFRNFKGELYEHNVLDEEENRFYGLWALRVADVLGDGKFKSTNEKRKALNLLLKRWDSFECWSSLKGLELERNLIRLVIQAGANPNEMDVGRSSIFDTFVEGDRTYGALEIAKADGFSGSSILEASFSELARQLTSDSKWYQKIKKKSELDFRMQNFLDRKELVYVLFQKDFYPRDLRTFEKLYPFVLEKNPDFFDNKKQQVIGQMERAKTPSAIYMVLTGQKGKEK